MPNYHPEPRTPPVEAASAEKPDPRPRVFRVWTDEGSVFAFKLEPRQYVHGVEVGPVDIRGNSQVAGKLIRILGIGSEPFVGSKITVSDVPREILDLGDGPVKFFDEETICGIQEIPVPEHVTA